MKIAIPTSSSIVQPQTEFLSSPSRALAVVARIFNFEFLPHFNSQNTVLAFAWLIVVYGLTVRIS